MIRDNNFLAIAATFLNKVPSENKIHIEEKDVLEIKPVSDVEPKRKSCSYLEHSFQETLYNTYNKYGKK